MRSPAKFLFDNDFAVAERGKSSVTLAEHAARIADAEAAGYRNGVAAAKAEAEQRAAAALERIAAALDKLARGLDAVEARLETEAVDVAVAVARKLAPELIAREPFADFGAGDQLLPPAGGGAGAWWCARQRPVAERARARSSTRRPAPRLRRPADRGGRARDRGRRLPHRMGGRRRHPRRGRPVPRSTMPSDATSPASGRPTCPRCPCRKSWRPNNE